MKISDEDIKIEQQKLRVRDMLAAQGLSEESEIRRDSSDTASTVASRRESIMSLESNAEPPKTTFTNVAREGTS